MKSTLFVLVVLLLFPIFSKAAIVTGCQATLGSNTIYYDRDGTILFNGVPQYRNDNYVNRYTLSEVHCYSGLGSGQGSCYIKGYGGPGDDYGTLVTFSTSPTDCPIDGYVPLLLFSFSSLSFFWIRKRVEVASI
ncbi:hypothetical protein OC25_07050 [Pedobacter kyungheensis]|uniref:Uncharacterized protein n=1 Tax=Pedobacter kyungheensis TaxID=1069985 RepID=A0A0C1DC02_9SPHI|nr:hypothetical protein [Pedobacter kyungheensis]KIA95091.1 hypothetical protein OC25_07050 [Pedobacter kyungheensis]